MTDDEDSCNDRGFFCDSGLCDLAFALVCVLACLVLVWVIPGPLVP